MESSCGGVAGIVRSTLRKTMNILLVIADSLRADALGCYGSPIARTPHIDALAAAGLRFETCYSTSPLCVPARAQILSGQHSHQTGNLLNPAWVYHTGDPVEVDGVCLDAGVPTLAELLVERDYFTAHLGKNHFYPRHKPYGFQHLEQCDFYGRHVYELDDYYLFLKGRGYGNLFRDAFGRVDASGGAVGVMRPEFGLPDRLCPHVSRLPAELQTTPWLGERVRTTLRAAPKERPFFLVASFYAPHDPYCVSAPDDRLIDPAAVRLPTQPAHLQPSAAVSGEQSLRVDVPEAVWRKNTAHYHANVHLIDREVGRMVDELKTLGRYEDTLILVTADHGETLGEHGIWGKNLLYEDCARIPLVCHHGGGGTAVGVTGETATLLDLFPTILAAACAPLPDVRLAGRALRLDGLCPADGRTVFGELANGVAQFFVRQGAWKYIRLEKDGLCELYDLARDPSELDNLSSTHPGKAREMDALLSAWLEAEQPHWRQRVPNLRVDWRALMARSHL